MPSTADLPTGDCVRCGFAFYLATSKMHQGGTRYQHRESLCAECRKVAAPSSRASVPRGAPIMLLEFGATVATLRLAVETARARLGMGIHGSQCGRDSLIQSMHDADGILARAQDAYLILAGTRVEEDTAA